MRRNNKIRNHLTWSSWILTGLLTRIHIPGSSQSNHKNNNAIDPKEIEVSRKQRVFLMDACQWVPQGLVLNYLFLVISIGNLNVNIVSETIKFADSGQV